LSSLRDELVACGSARKPFVAYEYGWDRTNYRTVGAFRAFLATLARNPLVAGDAFWALQAHRRGHGWMPIPATTSDRTAAFHIETGQWWALYYTGIRTLVNTAKDMATRAQVIRAHNYAMGGRRVPPHAVPPAPTGVSVVGARIFWQGSAGAKDYSVERASAARGPWRTVCRRCVTDSSDGFRVTSRRPRGSWYRVVPYNLGGRRGRPSQAVKVPPR
jgi:hypothetical protein